MGERKIQSEFFVYYVERDARRGKRMVPRRAHKGAIVDLNAADEERGDKVGALEPLDTPVVDDSAAAEVSVPDMSLDAIVEWLEQGQTIPDVLAQVGDNADLAAVVMDAEDIATGRTPREELVEGLQAVIDAAVVVPPADVAPADEVPPPPTDEEKAAKAKAKKDAKAAAKKAAKAKAKK